MRGPDSPLVVLIHGARNDLFYFGISGDFLKSAVKSAFDKAIDIYNGSRLRNDAEDSGIGAQEKVEVGEGSSGAQIENDILKIKLMDLADQSHFLAVFRICDFQVILSAGDQRQIWDFRSGEDIFDVLDLPLDKVRKGRSGRNAKAGVEIGAT